MIYNPRTKRSQKIEERRAKEEGALPTASTGVSDFELHSTCFDLWSLSR